MPSVLRIALLALLSLVTLATHAVETKSAEWTEEALLHDGRIVKVTMRADDSVSLDFWWPLPPVITTHVHRLSKRGISFVHPDTQENVAWYGEDSLTPVLVDIVGGIPYLIIYGRPNKKLSKAYGCPELPYIYLRHHPWEGWTPVPVEQAPVELQYANLSALEVDYWDDGKSLAQAQVAKRINNAQHRTSNHFQARIPRTYDEWNIKGKSGERYDRTVWDCRPPRELPPPLALPPPSEVTVEVVETINYEPVQLLRDNEWRQLTSNQSRSDACKHVFRLADADDYAMGQRFVEDLSGSKVVPYTVRGQRQMSVLTLCDEYIWFINHYNEDPFQVVVTKYSRQGDLIYRIGLRLPDSIPGFTRHYSKQGIRSIGGYLYIDWMYFNDGWDSKNTTHEWRIRRISKIRVKEPGPTQQ